VNVTRGDGYVERIRAAEIASVRPWFAAGQRVVEIGGMNGFQASVIAGWGCTVRSFDVAPAAGERFFDVEAYDGRRLPCADGGVDRVFSSNVLEHVRDLPALLAEIARVLRPEGLAIHLLPSPAWRFWHSAAHYGYLARWALGRAGSLVQAGGRPPSVGAAPQPDLGDFVRRKGKAWLIRRALWAGPHGEYPNALAELYYFSRLRWTRVFEEAGFRVVEHRPGGLFYSGYALLPGAFDAASRAKLAGWLGSACHIFVTAPAHRPGD
jgi:SAM-dependent methyltransferase